MSSRRRGISLLEVLFSIFVLSMGLLGLFSLIPAGKFMIRQGENATRSVTAGQAALAEIQTWGMLEDGAWSDASGAIVTGQTANSTTCIDPLFVMNNSGATKFPFGTSTSKLDMPWVSVWPNKTILHSTAPASSGPFIRNRRILDVFQMHDDLIFTVPEDDDARPQLIPRRPVHSLDIVRS